MAITEPNLNAISDLHAEILDPKVRNVFFWYISDSDSDSGSHKAQFINLSTVTDEIDESIV